MALAPQLPNMSSCRAISSQCWSLLLNGVWRFPSLALADTGSCFLSFLSLLQDPRWKPLANQHRWRAGIEQNREIWGHFNEMNFKLVSAVAQFLSVNLPPSARFPFLRSLMLLLHRFHGPRGASADLKSASSSATSHLFFNSCWQPPVSWDGASLHATACTCKCLFIPSISSIYCSVLNHS